MTDNAENTEKKRLPIGFFDSGVGGISVLKQAVRLMPHENFIYFGDSANAPYGTKTKERIIELSLANTEHLMQQGIKALTVACNTATSAAIGVLREKYPDMPVIGIEPALKPAALMGDRPRVIVMATPLTVREEKFNRLLARYEEKADITALPCPGLMEYVEAGQLEGGELRKYLEDLLGSCLKAGPVDAIVLGCTHYPFVLKEIRRIAGDEVKIIDGAEGTSRELMRRLREKDLLTDSSKKGSVVFEESRPEKIGLCRMLLES